LDEIKQVEKTTKEILTECRTDKLHLLALQALTRREKQIELKGKILGSFNKDKPDEGNKPPCALVPVSPGDLRKIGDILAKGDP
jgi:hypothetical protein